MSEWEEERRVVHDFSLFPSSLTSHYISHKTILVRRRNMINFSAFIFGVLVVVPSHPTTAAQSFIVIVAACARLLMWIPLMQKERSFFTKMEKLTFSPHRQKSIRRARTSVYRTHRSRLHHHRKCRARELAGRDTFVFCMSFNKGWVLLFGSDATTSKASAEKWKSCWEEPRQIVDIGKRNETNEIDRKFRVLAAFLFPVFSSPVCVGFEVKEHFTSF